jgi:hypothetical protein
LTPQPFGGRLRQHNHSMPGLSKRSAETRPFGGDRVFTDASGHLWSVAAHTDSRNGVTVIFTCITEGRQSERAILVDLPQEGGDPGDELLRAWLEAAPRIGRLT